ncbi:sulfate transporter family-domain-containing protein [Limtongia smithiae]|uniref:sulfate transporter family-domain-containing protein n=1 Tax=Limtongia smithiae TaxID=1125753 RepID=UPI0034CE530B
MPDLDGSPVSWRASLTLTASPVSLLAPSFKNTSALKALLPHASPASASASSTPVGDRDPQHTLATHVRDFTAEIASMALNPVLVPLPPAVPVPPRSSVASESNLTNLLRSASVSSSSSAENSFGHNTTVSSHPTITAADVYVAASDSSRADVSDDHPLLGSSDDEDWEPRRSEICHDLESANVRYGSQFGITTAADGHNRSRSLHSWIRSLLRPRKVLSYSMSPPIITRSRPLLKAAGIYIRENKETLLAPVKYIPSTLLGVLLNVLDGLSYGMILFPLSEPIFSSLGPDGLSMFYVSCIVSQIVYSAGGSVFKGGVGSEMIEVVPFFHSMAYTLLERIGEDRPDTVIATTILAYALSSIVTGAVFYLLGRARIGSLIGFFPRHILVGCIGGVGWFLIATGLEVSSRLEGNLTYTLETAKFLLQPLTLLKWGLPLCLTTILFVLEHRIKHPLLVPTFFLLVFGLFHLIVSVVSGISLELLRSEGWVFASPAASAPWYHFYSLYQFSAVDWSALFSTIPAMFALTFFGILHVPINVPALAVSVGVDNVDVDRELIAHGISNSISGLCGSIQNYLVYTNSLLFIRSGADSRIAGFMLAIATAAVMVSGPAVIGVIPVMVVGALIFLLGIELMKEALYDTWGRVSRAEYVVIAAIIFAMGAWDFVYGIIIGIILACCTFVVESARKPPIKATYSGSIARSTVRRHPFQQRFLKEVGDEIFVCKLTGFLFFGTIVAVESKIREVFISAAMHDDQFKHIKYIILDFRDVKGIDFSASEGFTRIRRFLESKNTKLIICAMPDDVAHSLQSVGAWSSLDDGSVNVGVFEDLNSALEWCEDELLAVYYDVRDHQTAKLVQSAIDQDIQQQKPAGIVRAFKFGSFSQDPEFEVGSPRQAFVHTTSSNLMLTDPTFEPLSSILQSAPHPVEQSAQSLPCQQQIKEQPLLLILQIFQDLSSKPATFWKPLCTYFLREEHKAGTCLYRRSQSANGFYLVESGILKAEYDYEQGHFAETIVAGTTAGELPFFSNTSRTSNMTIERDAVVWKLSNASWQNFLQASSIDQKIRQDIAIELLQVVLKLTAERFSAITAYVLTST